MTRVEIEKTDKAWFFNARHECGWLLTSVVSPEEGEKREEEIKRELSASLCAMVEVSR